MSTNKSVRAPIGVFDSGVGGLTVARELFSLLPDEQVIYFGDVGRYPYGGRSKEIITQFTRQDVAFLLEQNVKYIICACNTVSSVALADVAPDTPVPMLGVIEPGARAAVSATQNGRVGIIGTHATISSDSYAKTIAALDSRIKVFSLACPLFVPLAEEGYINKEASYLIAEDYLHTMRENKIDTLVLGCTHYPLLRSVIERVMGEQVHLIDSGRETARETLELFKRDNLRTDIRPESDSVAHRFYVSDVPEKFSQVATRFLGRIVDGITRIDISRY